MLPFLNVLNVGIVAAFAAIEEIQTIIEIRIDRKKIFLALSDFPIDTPPPPHSFSYHVYVTSYDGDGVSRHVITHIEKTFSLDIVVSRGLPAKSRLSPYPILPAPLPAHRPVRLSPPVPLPLQAMRAAPIVVPLPSKLGVPPAAVLSPLQAMRAVERYSAVRRDEAVRLCDFVPVAISFQLCSRSRFPSLLCRLLPS